MNPRNLWPLSVLLVLAACAPEPAPQDLDELTHYLYRVWDGKPAERVQGLLELERQLEAIELSAELGLDERSWSLSPLREEDVEGLDRPDRDLDALIGVGVAYQSRWDATCHAKLQIQADQLPTEPTALTYERTFPGTPKPGCFPQEDCEVLATVNDARRENLFLSASFILYKDFRWVTYEDEDGEERRAFYSRSWFDRSWPGDDERGAMLQSHSNDIWIERPDGTTWRMQNVWSETKLALDGVNDGTVLFTVKNATQGIYEAGDRSIETLGLCGDGNPDTPE